MIGTPWSMLVAITRLERCCPEICSIRLSKVHTIIIITIIIISNIYTGLLVQNINPVISQGPVKRKRIKQEINYYI